MRGLGSISPGGNIFHCIFLFSHGKASAGNIAILVHFEKTLMYLHKITVSLHHFRAHSPSFNDHSDY